jgi:leader peptidase (prepilin peptidase) / N-methyltransferase
MTQYAGLTTDPFTIVLFGILAAIAVIDARHGIIPDWTTFALAATGLFRAAATSHSALPICLSAAAAFAMTHLAHELFRYWRGLSGLGMGDIKFIAAAVFWIGLTGLPNMILIAALSALTFLLLRASAGFMFTPKTRIAFGPHLTVGLAYVSLFGTFH